MDRDDKLKVRADLLKKLNKDHGKGTIGVYSDMPRLDVETISSGSLGLDVALGVGGWARGRIVETYGKNASGKTTLALHAIAEAQKTGGLAAFIDAEHALDPSYAENLGVDMDDLVLSQPDNGEQALNITRELIESNAFDIIVIDSVSALTPIKEIEGEVGDYHVGAQARMMSQALRKLAGPVSSSKTTLVFINQTRMNIGVMFGNKETTSGGQALKFYATQRVEISKIGSLKKGDVILGGRTRCKVVKNKVAPPFKECEFDIVFGKGINKQGEILDAAIALNLIDKNGSWYTYDGENIGQGRDGALEWFQQNTDKLSKIEHVVRQHFGLDKD
jgi:recombination protein RecA